LFVPDAAAAAAATKGNAENDENDSSLFSFKNYSFPTSPTKLEGNCMILVPAGLE
jgi:hypothetical protein